MTSTEEIQIIHKILNGDNSAFESLVLDNQKKVYNLALRMTANEEDALNISQEVFLKAYLQLNGFRGKCRFSVWLYRMTHNQCIDLLCKKSHTEIISLTYQNEDFDEIDEFEIPDLRTLPEDSAIRHEMWLIISAGIDALRPLQREALIMREITGMSYKEIALTLQISEGTAKSRISRARQNLVGILAGTGLFSCGKAAYIKSD